MVWPFIEALAAELLNKHTLSGKEAKAIWELQKKIDTVSV
jgi:hypothetical protein